MRLTGRQTLAAALRTARYVNILPVRAVVLEPLPFVAQQQAGLFSGAAHFIQVNGAQSHREARRPACVLWQDSLAGSAMQKHRNVLWQVRQEPERNAAVSPPSTTCTCNRAVGTPPECWSWSSRHRTPCPTGLGRRLLAVPRGSHRRPPISRSRLVAGIDKQKQAQNYFVAMS